MRPAGRHEGGLSVIDEMTRDRLRISTDGIAGPYLMVPMAQLAHVRDVLDRHQVRYWVDSDAISLDRQASDRGRQFRSGATRADSSPSWTRPADGRAPPHAPPQRDPRPRRLNPGPTGRGPGLLHPHTRQAWRLAQQVAREGHPGRHQHRRGQRAGSLVAGPGGRGRSGMLTVHLPESVLQRVSPASWKTGSSASSDFWLTAHPEDLDTDFNKATGRTGKKKQEEIQIPLSEVLAAPDRDAILGVEIEKGRPGSVIRAAGQVVPIPRRAGQARMSG